MNDTLTKAPALFNKTGIIEQILGTTDTSTFFAAIFFGILGAIVMMLIEVMTRDPKKSNSPVAFSWSFFLKDNFLRFLVNILLVICVIRFAPNLIHQDISTFWGFVIGLGADQLAVLIKKKKSSVFKEDGSIGNGEDAPNHSDN